MTTVVKLHRSSAGRAAIAGAFMVMSALWAGATEINPLALHEKNPVLDVGPGGSWDDMFIDPGSVIYEDGKFHMFYSALPGPSVPLAIGYAYSEDGVNWQRGAANPILDIKGTGLEGYAVNSNGAVLTHNGKWALYFSVVEPNRTWYGSIGRAIADTPQGPWKTDPQPVLKRGPKGSWDANKIGDANVLKVKDGYVMYYTGFGDSQAGAFTEEHGNIGMATSRDGVNWKKHDDPATTDAAGAQSDPVLSINKAEGAWDSWNTVDPNVQRTGDGWAMIYRGNTFETSTSIGLATSKDGINWTRASQRPIFTQQDAGAKIYFSSYLRRGGKDLVYLEVGSGAGTKVMLAIRNSPTH